MRRGERIGFRAKFGSGIIPLLFPCYSPANSAAIPLLIPLLFPLSTYAISPQMPESANVFEAIVAKNGRIGIFFPVSRGISDPESVNGEPPRSGYPERGMLEKYA